MESNESSGDNTKVFVLMDNEDEDLQTPLLGKEQNNNNNDLDIFMDRDVEQEHDQQKEQQQQLLEQPELEQELELEKPSPSGSNSFPTDFPTKPFKEEGNDQLSPPYITMAIIVFTFCFFSSGLLVANKIALVMFPYPNTLLAIQFAFAAICAAIIGKSGLYEVDALQWDKVKLFCPAVVIFYLALGTNFKALQEVNVDTLVVFRTATPLCVALADFMVMGMALPSARTWFSLISISLSAGYVFWKETSLSYSAWFWCVTYYFIICFDMIWLKKITQSVQMSTFGRVLYANLLALPLALLSALFSGEFKAFFHDYYGRFGTDVVSQNASEQLLVSSDDTVSAAAALIRGPSLLNSLFFVILLTCVMGFGISWSAWKLRSLISALSFTVIAAFNKLASIGINIMVWDRHSSSVGTFIICAGVISASLYESPKERSSQPFDDDSLKLPTIVDSETQHHHSSSWRVRLHRLLQQPWVIANIVLILSTIVALVVSYHSPGHIAQHVSRIAQNPVLYVFNENFMAAIQRAVEIQDQVMIW